MHIPDGFLSTEVALACAVPAAAAVGIGLRQANRTLDERRVPLLGVTAAFIFAAQMINFPVAGGTSGHFLGAALATILLGPWLAVMTGAALTAVELAWSGTVPLGTVLPAMLGTHLLIAAGEAVITVAAVSAVLATRPDLLPGVQTKSAKPVLAGAR